MSARTIGYPNAQGPAIITGGAAVAPGAPPVDWPIPDTPGWNGNFTVYPTGATVMSGSSLAEFGFNQLWSGASPPRRETFDISNVPLVSGQNVITGPAKPVYLSPVNLAFPSSKVSDTMWEWK
uniref:Uncharacterized protein n=1 Tax=Marseillevirus LCMAC101 TaxID=2506602 RepID=A0A481YS98_9VIRU|nr:MAG: hypothetical protein LCMAC101_02100 [Marseillevirus LCMAC101]